VRLAPPIHGYAPGETPGAAGGTPALPETTNEETVMQMQN